MPTQRIALDPKIRFLVSVPDGQPEQASPFQGFAPSLCRKSGLLGFIHSMPSDIFELTPDVLPFRLARRIAGQAPINWYGQSPRALKSLPQPLEIPFTIILLDESENIADYDAWIKSCLGPVTLVADKGGQIAYADLSFDAVQARFIEVCGALRALGNIAHVDEAEAAIASWVHPEERHLAYEVGGHATIFPNAAALHVCGFVDVAPEPFRRMHEGEGAHLEQIVKTTNSVLDEREANPPSIMNQIYPRTPDLNLYCPATYDLKSAFELRADLDRNTRRDVEVSLRLLEKQPSYSFTIESDTQKKVLLGITAEALMAGEKPTGNPIMAIRQQELWLGTYAVSCLAASEIGAVVRLPNRLNLSKGVVRAFAQHYRADKPQMLKRGELFRGVQRAIADGIPEELRALVDRSKDGIRIIADAHLEWLDVRGIPLGLRYNVARIPVTPGNAFIGTLTTTPPIQATPDDFKDILIVSGLSEADVIAEQFRIAFDIFGRQWKDKLRIKFVRVSSRKELVEAINSFEGMMMVFDGHGSHRPDHPGLLWLGDEGVDVWSLRGEISRIPPIVILSACDTHAADRNHATVANGFLTLGARSVLGSVFPLHASYAAMFVARLLFRVSDYLPAAIGYLNRSLTWLEVVSGMLRRQLTTDILHHLEAVGLIAEDESLELTSRIQGIVDAPIDDPFTHARKALLDHGIPEDRLDREIHTAISASSTISYVHLGRPETILINTPETLETVIKHAESVEESS